MTQRTTNKDKTPGGIRRMLALGTVVALTLLAMVAQASGPVDDELEVRLVSASDFAPQWPPDLVIEGIWVNSCIPGLQRSRMLDNKLDVYLRSERGNCAQVPTPFQLKLNPAREAGLRQMPLGIHQLRLFLAHDNGSNELIAFRLLRSGGDDTRSRPESGFWWSVPGAAGEPALAGNGLSIEQQGDSIAVTWLSYEAGTPVWYFGSAQMPGKTVRINMSRLVGGGEAFSGPNSAPIASPQLALNIEFLTPAHAKAWLVRERPGSARSVEIQRLDLLRLPFAEGHPGSNWQGEWVLVTAGSNEARVIDLTRMATADAETFRVSDGLDSVSLRCRLDSVGERSIASFCTLVDGATVLGDFDQVGLDRLSGLNVDGEAVRLVRLPR